MIIRNAKKEEAALLVDLLLQLGANYKLTITQMENRIVAFNRPDHQLLVAEKDSAIIGVIAIGCYESFRLTGRICHIDTLVINKNYRGTGVGKKLIAAAEKFAKEHGAIIIELTSANHRKITGTHAFYESLDYKNQITLDYSYFLKEVQ